VTQRVVLIHGPPACGKLTTAKALQARIGGVILHNHLTYNLARILFEIDDPRLVALHRELRLVMLRYALAEDMPDLILTLVYAEPDPGDTVAEIVALIESHGAELVPVYLECPETELLIRVAAEGRTASGKLTSTERLKTLLAGHRHPPLPHPMTHIIANGEKSAERVASEIQALLESASGS
jgi:hypothetical protein